MSIAKLGTALVAGFLIIAGAQVANAASPITDAFLANVRPNVAFLGRSSRLAVEKADSNALRAFARDGIAEAASTADALDVLTPSDHAFAVAAAAPAGTEGLLTGRSVATQVVVKPAGFGQAANARMPLGDGEVASLRTLSGRAFDDVYWTKQLDALSQLRADYTSYIARGDDTALVAVARRELPKVESRLLALSKL